MTENLVEVDQHAHSYQEIRNEEGISYEVDVAHERNGFGNIAVKHQSGQEGSEYTFQS